MLNILASNEITNALVVVTRYFGGILLGTGGLVRAYSDATSEAIKQAEIIKKDYGLEAYFLVDYPELEKIKYYFKQNSIKIIDSIYEEKIKVIVEITEEKLNNIIENKAELNFKFEGYEICRRRFIEFVENSRRTRWNGLAQWNSESYNRIRKKNKTAYER